MQNKWKFIAGIDVWKKTFDIALGDNIPNASLLKARFAKNLPGYDKLEKWLKDQQVNLSDTLVCLEHTGIYPRLLIEYLQEKNATVWAETPVQIKWSLGIQRGKNDAIDSERMMTYAFRNQDKVIEYKSKDKSLQQVADLLALRSRLQKYINLLKRPVKKLRDMGLEQDAKLLEKGCSKSLKALQKELKALDEKILSIIQKDQDLHQKYEFATSVRCVGVVAASYLLVYTNGFTRFENVKQLASFSGIAPFEYSSGTSIRGKTKVHPMANKTLKTILHMCAVSSLRHNPEMKTYFARKVAEGKNKMLVLNAVRNKILARVSLA